MKVLWGTISIKCGYYEITVRAQWGYYEGTMKNFVLYVSGCTICNVVLLLLFPSLGINHADDCNITHYKDH